MLSLSVGPARTDYYNIIMSNSIMSASDRRDLASLGSDLSPPSSDVGRWSGRGTLRNSETN